MNAKSLVAAPERGCDNLRHVVNGNAKTRFQL